jgi:hypothetical protein
MCVAGRPTGQPPPCCHATRMSCWCCCHATQVSGVACHVSIQSMHVAGTHHLACRPYLSYPTPSALFPSREELAALPLFLRVVTPSSSLPFFSSPFGIASPRLTSRSTFPCSSLPFFSSPFGNASPRLTSRSTCH